MTENKEWKEVKLSEITTKLGDGLHGTPKYSDNGEFYFINGNNLMNGKIVFTERTRKVTEEEFFKYKKELTTKTIMVSINGTLGNIAVYDGEKVVLGKSVCYFNIKENVDKDFIKYILQDNKFKNYIINYASGTTIKNLSLKAMRNFNFFLPPLEEQETIAAILKSLDDKIELNNKMNETLEEMAQTMFKEWFVNFNFPNEEGKPYKDNGGKMIESELGMIPEGWRVGEFKEVIEKIIDNRGKTPPLQENGIRLLEGYQLFCEKAFPDFEAGKKQKFVSRETYEKWFRAGHPKYLDILCATVGTLPKWCFAPNNKNICIAQNVIALRTNENISSYFLRGYMNTREFIGEVDGRTVTTAQPSIKIGHLTSIRILIPKKEIINWFDKVVEGIYEKLLELDLENQTLIKTRDILLPKLMSGEIGVK